MESVTALIVLVIVPFGMILWWVPVRTLLAFRKRKIESHANLWPHKHNPSLLCLCGPNALFLHLNVRPAQSASKVS
jgi:hypothetical protein